MCDIPNGLGNVPEGVDSGSSDGFLVCFEQLQQLKTDSHPLSGTHMLSSTISNPSNQINAVLLHFLMSDEHNKWAS